MCMGPLIGAKPFYRAELKLVDDMADKGYTDLRGSSTILNLAEVERLKMSLNKKKKSH